MKALGKFLGLGWTDRFLLLEAWLYLGAARAALLAIPFRRIAPHLGRQLPAEDRAPSRTAADAAARRVAGAVELMARHTPWESACLAQTIAGKFMLRRRGLSSHLFLGTRKDETGSLTAHAWLQAGDEILIGGAGHETFTVLGRFRD